MINETCSQPTIQIVRFAIQNNIEEYEDIMLGEIQIVRGLEE
jgi:predicted DNA-binding protein